jgi:glycosyltransferase involved in cell wall biosynthesis
LQQLDEIVPESLTHPVRGLEFMRNSCGITLILEKLKELVPEKSPSIVLWPSAQSELFGQPLPKGDRKAFGIPDGHTVIVYTGHVNHANAREIRCLYLAVGRLNREGVAVTLVRTGENIWALRLLSEEEDWIKPYVIELGTVRRELLPSIMATADLFVQPGRPDAFNDYRFPSKLPEFLSIGRPVILPAANIGLQMVHGKDAWILPDADEVHIAEAVRTIMGDAALYDRLSAGAVEFFRTRLDWKRTAKELADFYG